MESKRIRKTIAILVGALGAIGIGTPHGAAAPLSLDVRSENRMVLIPGPGDGTIQIQVIAPDEPVPADRPRLNMALVIDRSGSMTEARKLDYVKTAAHQLVDMMGPEDILSIVAYDHLVQVPWPASRVGRNREALHRIVEGLYPGGSTFLSGGLEEGFRQARGSRRPGYLNRVLLLSDGLANVGVVNRAVLRDRAAQMAESGVSVSTFGVGYHFDEVLLTMTASGGGGNYHYLGDPERIVAALAGELRTASRTVASEVEIVIRLKKDCRFGSVPGREWRREGDSYVIRLGDLPAGERRTLIANVNILGDRPGLRDVGEVAVRYRDPATAKVITAARQGVSLELVADKGRYETGFDRDVQSRKAVVESSVMVQEAARLADEGKKGKAQEILDRAAAGLAAAPASPEVRMEMEQTRQYREKLDSLKDMNSEEARKEQKEIRYRSYEQLQRR